MKIDFIYDPSVAGAPAAFKTALAAAAQYLDTLITNNITINIAVGWGEDNGAAIGLGALAEGAPVQGIGMSYGALEAELSTHATTAADRTFVGSLPTTDPTGGGQFYIASAQEKAWGLLPADNSAIDGAIGFSSTDPFSFDPNARAQPGLYDFIGTAEHEITHAMGRFAGLQWAPGWYSPMDLTRYTGPGNLALTAGSPASFSVDGGKTLLVPFDGTPTGDAGDWASSVKHDAFGYGAMDSVQSVSVTDVRMMDVLGFNVDATVNTATHSQVARGSTGKNLSATGTRYSAAVSGVAQGIIPADGGNLDLTTFASNPAIHVAFGLGDMGNIFRRGANSWSTSQHAPDVGHAASWAVTASDFMPAWLNSTGAGRGSGITGKFGAAGEPGTDIIPVGYGAADIGRQSIVTYGTSVEPRGVPAVPT
jgi:hypothetical protein